MIEIKDLTFSYTGEPPFLIENMSMSIPGGQLVSIIGENGSAKSTLVKLMVGLLTPLKGSITIASPSVAYVPQRMESFNKQFPITVEEVYKIHLKALGMPDEGRIDKALADVSMSGFKKTLIGDLSGGQTQRIFIGRALLGDPEVIILDEPSTGMDLRSQKEVRGILRQLREKNVTILTVEHNISAAIHSSDYIIRMGDQIGVLYDIKTFKTNIQHEDVDNMLVFRKGEF
ncbi:metal ABC transporter ATP-binding protein [Proteiniclasticum sp. BAD-10]|uniref:Metal ABC transporter ATP-binding protein n=1 Tax=Proteiniclasticum sediminis TaxID=2804028 RepID=A0A941CQ83_9CLOT|nr:metal ABC transporter ATP-binding protein [Proteiniclasticum sediminis]MBR0575783.1 metal ABC transporter ATP-binding protein [Proteiniclasticum sediminis]